MTPTKRKTSKAQMREAVDSFLYSLSSFTGGTAEECRNQAPRGIQRLTGLAANVAALVANPSKPLLADAHLMEMATGIPARLARYAERYLAAPGAPEVPSNVIQFPTKQPTAANLFGGVDTV